jgi:hypothetical protein
MGNMPQHENDDDLEHYHFIIYNKTLIILYPCYKPIHKTFLMEAILLCYLKFNKMFISILTQYQYISFVGYVFRFL